MFQHTGFRGQGHGLRRGTTIVETAVILPVFMFIMLALIEFAHAQMVTNVLNSAVRQAARRGATEGTSTSDVRTRVSQTIGSAINAQKVSVFVNDASAFDSASPPAANGAAVESLPAIEVADAEARQMFVVRARVNYNDVALVPMSFMNGVVLDAQSFIRHE